MQPQQNSGHHQSYDFIMSPSQPQKKPLLPGGNSMTQRLLMIAGGGTVLIILIIVIASVLNSGPNVKDTLVKVAQEQTEIIRVIDTAGTSGSQTTKTIAVNTSLALTSDSKTLISVLGEHGIKINAKQLSARRNPDTDKKLEAAKAASAFDATFLQILDDQLTEYQTTLQSAYTNSKSKEVKQTINTEFQNAKLLRTQIEKNQN